jgi:adenylosuccinate lyase
MYGEPMLDDFAALGAAAQAVPFRGILGPVGTAKDQIGLLGSAEAVEEMNDALMRHFGFERRLHNPGQVFPRSIEANALSSVISATNHAANYAIGIRLATGLEDMTEGFDPERVCSSAMPHKMNPSRAERICSLAIAMRGYGTMLQEVSGSQWYAGDVSCSAARRLGVHDGFYAADGALNTLLQILEDTSVFVGSIERERHTYAPYLASTALLTALQHPPHGEAVGREDAHGIIKEHAVKSIMNYRGGGDHTFLQALADDPKCPLTLSEIEGIVKDASTDVGDASRQLGLFVESVNTLERDHPYLLEIKPIKTV